MNRLLTCGLSLVALGLCLNLFAAEWDGGTATKDDSYKVIDCGAILGDVGGLYTFTTTAITNGLQTEGGVGAWWDGEQYPKKSGPQDNKTNYVTHTYTKEAGGTLTRDFLHVDLHSTITASGSAKQLDPTDPQWWWDTTATVTEHAPKVEMFNPGTGDWADFPVVWDHNTQAAGSGADASNNNQPPTPPSTQGTSSFVAGLSNQDGNTVGLTQTFPAMTKIRATAKWTSFGGPSSVDNAIVMDEQLDLDFTFKTWFSQ